VPFFYLAAERRDELVASDDEQHGVGRSGSDEPAKLAPPMGFGRRVAKRGG
jgi:hypothetical protein